MAFTSNSPLAAMRLGIHAANQSAAMQDRQDEIAKTPLRSRRVALQPVVEIEHGAGAGTIPDDRIERRQQRGMRRAQAAALCALQPRLIVAMHVGR